MLGSLYLLFLAHKVIVSEIDNKSKSGSAEEGNIEILRENLRSSPNIGDSIRRDRASDLGADGSVVRVASPIVRDAFSAT